MAQSNDLRKQLQDQADKGQKFESYVREGVLASLDDDIFRPIFNEAYAEFLAAKPEDAGTIARAQAKGQVIERFKKKFEDVIQKGREAQAALLQMDEMEEAEA